MKYIITLFALIILISCSKKEAEKLNYEIKIKDGIEHIINEDRPSVAVENLKVNLKKSFVINGTDSLDIEKSYFTKPKYFTVDSKDNIYIFDASNNIISKFDNTGKFVTSFGGEGNGPGEFDFVMGMACLKDTIIAMDTPVRKLNKFDTNGKFIETRTMGAFTSLFQKIFTANGKIWCQRMSFKRYEDHVEMYKLIEIRDSKFNQITLLDSSSLDWPPKDIKGENSVSKCVAVNKENIYMADKGELYKYEVKVLKENGELQQVIKRKFSRLRRSAKERDLIVEEAQKKGKKRDNEKLEDYLAETNIKPAIRWIYLDKYDRLLVNESRNIENHEDKRLMFSFFKDGIFLNSILLEIDVTYPNLVFDVISYNDIIFIHDKIYAMNTHENRITVYEY